MLSLGAYLTGVAELAAIAIALGFGAVRLRRAVVPGWAGAPARLVEAVLAISTLLVICEVLGLLGAFHEIPLLATCVVVGISAGLVAGRVPTGPPAEVLTPASAKPEMSGEPRVAPSAPAPRRRAFGGHRLQLGLAVVAAGVAFAHWSIPTLGALDRGIYGFDSQWYHLPFAARFAETGSVWDFHQTTPVLLSWFYPANSELLHAAGMVVFDRDLLSPLVNLGWLALALLAAWCLGRPWGVGGLAVLGAFVVLDAGVLADQAGEARNDAMALATILAAAALIVQRPIPLATAGLAAGLALGTRFTSLAPVAALTVGAIWLARPGRGRPRPRSLRAVWARVGPGPRVSTEETASRGPDRGAAAGAGLAARTRAAAVWTAAVLATGGLWYLRNLVATGSPLPQLDELGPLSLPGPDQALGGRPSFSVAHYATDFGVWADWFAPALRDALGLLWPLVLALAAAGAILALARGPTRPVRVLGAVAVVTALVYLVTPVTASGPEGRPLGFGPNLRYLAPGLALALAILPVSLVGLGPRLRIAGAAALVAVAIGVAAEPERWEGGHLAAAAAAGLVLALALAGTALLLRSRSDGAARVSTLGRGTPSSRGARSLDPVANGLSGGKSEAPPPWVGAWAGHPAVVTGLAVLALAVVVAGYLEQRRYLEGRYADPAKVLPNPGLDSVFVWARDLEDARIGTTTTRQYPLYGTELSNHVQFVGVERPDAGFTRATSCEEWRRAVDAGDYDYLVTALDRLDPNAPARPPERAWTERSPSATEIVRDGPATVYELEGPLDPDRCNLERRSGGAGGVNGDRRRRGPAAGGSGVSGDGRRRGPAAGGSGVSGDGRGRAVSDGGGER